MLTFWIHLIAFYEVVVLNCIQPVNWKACAPVHEWLLPELVQGYKIWQGHEHIYQNEKDYLNELR
tara:strand:- start:27358 stop:27552 length:195 start_codon:yes stop_codon:yes gene_type:complete